MTDTAERVVGPVALGVSEATLYTVPAATTVVVRHIHIANSGALPVAARLSIGAYAAGTAFLGDASIPANGTYDWSGFMVLAAGETLRGSAGSAGALAVAISGVAIA